MPVVSLPRNAASAAIYPTVFAVAPNDWSMRNFLMVFPLLNPRLPVLGSRLDAGYLLSRYTCQRILGGQLTSVQVRKNKKVGMSKENCFYEVSVPLNMPTMEISYIVLVSRDNLTNDVGKGANDESLRRCLQHQGRHLILLISGPRLLSKRGSRGNRTTWSQHHM